MDAPALLAAATTPLLLMGAAGCGGDEAASPTATTEPPRTATAATPLPHLCKFAGHTGEGRVLLCHRRPADQGWFLVDEGGARRVLEIGRPRGTATARDAGRVGHWEWASVSPDGLTILAHWSAECEVPFAFLAQLSGGRPRIVTGERDWATSPTSYPHGWTTDGRAIVYIPHQPACGQGVPQAGVYLFRAAGKGQLVRPANRANPAIKRSIDPRPAASLQ